MIEKESKTTQNAANIYVLPMLQLNKSSFGTVKNVINVYVDKLGYIVVDVRDENLIPTKTMFEHPQYITDYNTEEGLRIIYAIPDEYQKDMELFTAGKYSQLSADLKVAISKLDYAHKIVNCFNPSKEDRQKIADELHVSVDLIKEIRSAPSENNFISIK